MVTTREQNTYSGRGSVLPCRVFHIYSLLIEKADLELLNAMVRPKELFLHHYDHKNTSRLISNALTGYLQNKSASVPGMIA
jgi:hypothetical protein